MNCIQIKFDTAGIVPVYLGHDPYFYTNDVTDVLLRLDPDKIFIIIDENILEKSSQVLNTLYHLRPVYIKKLPGGECSKTFQSVQTLAESFFSEGCTKNSMIIAIGGGSIMNLAGLIAGLMYRGIKLVYFPTTFLAQHDVVPSRKTAINMAHRKNNFGMYYSAHAVFVDTNFITELQPLDFFSGMGELLKNGLIFGEEKLQIIFEFLAAYQKNSDIIHRNEWLQKLVYIGIDAKKGLLALDATELKEAMLFEYGHTVGHAIEFATGLPHGIAIMYGMLFCSFASFTMGIMSAESRRIHDELIKQLLVCGGSSAIPASVDFYKIIEKSLGDNKRGLIACKPDEITCVLLSEIGLPIKKDDSFLSPINVQLCQSWLQKEFIELTEQITTSLKNDTFTKEYCLESVLL